MYEKKTVRDLNVELFKNGERFHMVPEMKREGNIMHLDLCTHGVIGDKRKRSFLFVRREGGGRRRRGR